MLCIVYLLLCILHKCDHAVLRLLVIMFGNIKCACFQVPLANTGVLHSFSTCSLIANIVSVNSSVRLCLG